MNVHREYLLRENEENTQGTIWRASGFYGSRERYPEENLVQQLSFHAFSKDEGEPIFHWIFFTYKELYSLLSVL